MVVFRISPAQLRSLVYRSSCRTLSTKTSRLESLNKEWNITLGRADDDAEAYTIQLNNFNLKTPMKNLLKIKDETLALAVANEWKGRAKKKKLDLKTMHLTTLCYESIDNPFKESQEDVIKTIIEYLRFDTVRFRDVNNEEFLQKQSRHWDPLIGWFEHRYDCHLPIDYGDIMNTSELPQNTIEIVQRTLASHQRWPLVGVKFMTQNLKSFLLATCLMTRFLKVEQAVELSRLETRHQVEKWSKVEWEHDLDEQNTTARVAAGTLFYLLSL